MKYFFYGSLLLAAFFTQAEAVKPTETVVKVEINQQLYVFDQLPRLADVLAPVALERNWYWPASALYRTDDDTAQVLKQQVLAQLTLLQQEHSTDTQIHAALITMMQQVQSWTLATRILIPIDYDFARVRAALNPRFTAGNYVLQLYTRPSQVRVFGLVESPLDVAHKSAENLASYLTEMKMLDAAAKDVVFLLQADGRIITVSVAAWQRDVIEAMPGAQLFVPFKVPLFSRKWQRLNQDIIELARHRVLL